ncbi:MAG: hypothetical protein WCX95_02835, partial [Candidatus Gracilibacteria bacterium]
MGVIEYKRRDQRIKVKQTLRVETQKTIRALIITLTAMIIILSGVFLAITANGAGKGYALEQAKLKNEDLKTRNANLKAKLTDITSFTTLDENGRVIEMTPLS